MKDLFSTRRRRVLSTNASSSQVLAVNGTGDSPPFCTPIACDILFTFAALGVTAFIVAMVWQIYQKHLFKRERLRFQERETELRTAMEYIESSRSLHSNMSGTTSVRSWVAPERGWVSNVSSPRPRDDTAILEP
ncbi:hypothetical protein THRCLA_22141 [Thraustotheca clavata]|uniref:Uncharacterized protein n=1 Tax=Thraustotheca clavata TaxID=74557 RepID=A0A1V9ZBQ7_9STRA|nr:hypothetical protein THRCLA_22141 [Thraustotheca clavata]